MSQIGDPMGVIGPPSNGTGYGGGIGSGHGGGVGACDAGTDHSYFGGPHPGHPAHQHARATTRSGHRRGADLNGEASGNLAHRGKQRQ